MLTITIQVDRPAGQAIGIKEAIAMDLEKYGNVRVVKIEETAPAYRQMTLGDAIRQTEKGKSDERI